MRCAATLFLGLFVFTFTRKKFQSTVRTFKFDILIHYSNVVLIQAVTLPYDDITLGTRLVDDTVKPKTVTTMSWLGLSDPKNDALNRPDPCLANDSVAEQEIARTTDERTSPGSFFWLGRRL